MSKEENIDYKIYTDEQYKKAMHILMSNGWTGFFQYSFLNKVIEEKEIN
jgi:hypothetical protein